MVTFVWILQILLALLFSTHGSALIVKPARVRDQLHHLPYSSRFLSFIGVCEVLGGLGLILPLGTGILPWLTPLAAAGLAIIMAGAVWTHMSAKEGPQIGVTAVVALLLVVVACARWPLFNELA